MSHLANHNAVSLRRGVIIYVHALIFLLLGIVIPAFTETHSAETMIPAYCIFITGIFVWCLWSWRFVNGRLFDPYTLFLIAAFLFNGGQALLQVFGLNAHGLLNGRFAQDTLFSTLVLVIIGLMGFHLGGLLAYNAKHSQVTPDESVSVAQHIQDRALRSIGWILLCVAIIPSLMQLGSAINVALTSGYFALFQRDAQTGFDAAPRILATFLIPAAMFILGGSRQNRFSKYVSLCLVSLYVLVELFLGHRGTAIPIAVAYIWLWSRVIQPLPKSVLFTATIIGLVVVIPLVRVIRNVPGQDRLLLEYIVESYTSIDNPVVEAISEMGGSMITVAYTLQLIPTTQDFNYGLDYVYATFTIVPNFFGTVHPTIARGTPSVWLIQTVSPYTAARGGSIGYSFIAEAFLNFGWIGTPIVLGVIGFFFAKFTTWADKPGEAGRQAVLATFLAFFLFYVRADSASVFRPLIWYSLLPYLLATILANSIRGRAAIFSGNPTSVSEK